MIELLPIVESTQKSSQLAAGRSFLDPPTRVAIAGDFTQIGAMRSQLLSTRVNVMLMY
jgi:hypothetical protein